MLFQKMHKENIFFFYILFKEEVVGIFLQEYMKKQERDMWEILILLFKQRQQQQPS
jgi:hypothetical protein